MKNIGRNDPCMCGSGRKYKQCCLKRDERLVTAQRSETSSTAHTIQIALKHQQAGRFVQAEALYRQILQIEPHHPDALHFLGIIAHETGRNQIAVELIGKVISLNPDFIAAHNNIGLALHQLGRLEEAIEHYRKAISLRSDYADAHSNLGFTLQAQGKLDQAAKHYQKAVSYTHLTLPTIYSV